MDRRPLAGIKQNVGSDGFGLGWNNDPSDDPSRNRPARSGDKHRRYLFDSACDQKRAAADDPDLGLTMLVRPQPCDVLSDNEIVAAARW
jgi:hypothetical protein